MPVIPGPEVTPCREEIVLAVLARLDQITAVAGLHSGRNRVEPFEEHELPWSNLVEGDEERFAIFTGQDDYELILTVEHFARTLAELARMRATVDMALTDDFTLGGLVQQIETAGEADPSPLAFEHVAAGHVASSRNYRVRYATLENDPFTFA
jgi:hypothetical protein